MSLRGSGYVWMVWSLGRDNPYPIDIQTPAEVRYLEAPKVYLKKHTKPQEVNLECLGCEEKHLKPSKSPRICLGSFFDKKN